MKTLKRCRKVVLKAYRIPYQMEDYYVAALNDVQAVGTLAAHVEDDATACGPAELVDPTLVPVSYEQNDGSYAPGTLAEMMPFTDAPEVLIDPDYP